LKAVLVTGASGFIGSHLVRRCLKEGYHVRALVRKGNAVIPGLRHDGVEVSEGDIRDANTVARAVKGCDLVFHAAALTSDWGPLQDFIDINVSGTRNVCEAAIGFKTERLIYLSSFESFDHSRLDRIDEKTPFSVRNQSYADTKIRGTETVLEYAGRGLKASVVYPVWVYGPGDRTLIPLLADIIRRRLMFYWSHQARMSLVYIDNLVDLLMLAATHPDAAGETFLACDGVDMTFEEFCERVAKGIHVPPPSFYLPHKLTCMLAGIMETVYRLFRSPKRPLLTRQAVTLLASRAFVDASKARRVLGWSPGIDQDVAIAGTLDWLVRIDPSEWKQK
jgi:nucleoside-diphosphate-sugar epimerase